MHFWIDKRSQCGYNGRRVPPSLSAGIGRSRRDRRLKPMVTPVHRFQTVECVTGGSSGRRPPAEAAPILHRPGIPPSIHQYQYHISTGNYGNRADSNGAARLSPSRNGRAIEVDDGIYPDVSRSSAERSVSSGDGVDEEGRPADPTTPATPPQPLMPAYLKCGVWASFALATMFVAGAKFYFDHQIIYEQGSGMEVLVFCALLVMFLLGACSISLCRTRTVPPLGPIVVASHSRQGRVSRDSDEDLALGTLLDYRANAPLEPPTPEPPPPPYHIAVLLPQRNDSTYISMEAPPPTYEKAVS